MDPEPFNVANTVLDFLSKNELEKDCEYAIYLPN
jgi:hypothetical protein